MDNFKCPLCHRKSNEPINLRCDHHPCFQCASQILAIDHQSTLQTKYRIVCPICHKKTITYDLRHLIINNTEQDEDLYVTTKYILKKPDMFGSKKSNNYIEHTNTNINYYSKQNSQGSIIGNSSLKSCTIECKKHQGNFLLYFCEQCVERNQNQIFFCGQCCKNHKHKLIGIQHSHERLAEVNEKKKQQLFCNKAHYLNESLNFLMQRKENLHVEFENLYKQVSEEFKILYQYLNEQYQATKKELKNIYNKQCQQLKSSLSLGQKLYQSLKQLQKIPTQNCTQVDAQVNYSICVIQIQKAIEVNKAKLSQRFQVPKVVKKSHFPLNPSEKYIQISGSRGKQSLSRPITPTNSARFFNFPNEGTKNGKAEKIECQSKQNFKMISPKNYYSSKAN